MITTQAQEPSMQKFYSPEYGFLHACKKDGCLWYNLTDICNTLSMKLREAEAIVRATKGKIKEMNVRRQKITSCNRFVDQDGLLTILIDSRKNQSNGYRRWIDSVVTFSLLNPSQSHALDEVQITDDMTSYEVRLAYIDQARRKAKSKKTQAQSTQMALPNIHKKKAEPIPAKSAQEEFVPADGHMSVEEFFRKEMHLPEFISNLDGVMKCARQHIRTLSHKQSREAQHCVNVLRVFRGMLNANAKNLTYCEAPACL